MQLPAVLQTNLNFLSLRLSDILTNLPVELKTIRSTDSAGRDEQDVVQIVKALIFKLKNLSAELDSPFKIAVVGSQGTGKSTIINLLLGEALMPSTTMENESAVIKLDYPPNEELVDQAVFELSDNTTKRMSIEEANRIIDKNRRFETDELFIKKIRYVTFYLKKEQLKKIQLINTPGMNVITDDFYPKVQHLFNESDIILWVNSKEQILDDFNSWLIKKIHADNDKIVGLITFPDNLYRQDEISGVTDVVTQFMEKLENRKLLRIDGTIGLFIFNGKFAQISEGHKTNTKFIQDVDDLEEDEENLRMLYNFLHHGFAYSDDPKNIDILKRYNLYGLENFRNQFHLDDEFQLQSFYNYCLNEGYCLLNTENNTALYTKKGLHLLGEASQYYSFGRFSDDILIPMSKESKLKSVKSRVKRILSKTDNVDNSMSRLLQIKKKLEVKKASLSEEERTKIANFNLVINQLNSEYKQWYSNLIDYESDIYRDKLIDIIIVNIEKEISPIDFMKEIKNSLTPSFLKSSNESPVAKKISEIISNAIESVLPKQMEKIAKDANNHIELILLKLEKEFLIKKQISTAKGNSNVNFSSNLDLSIILKNITKLIKPLLIKVMINLAKKDLRKGARTFLKRNITKPLIILIRKILTKMGVNFAKKKVASTAAKAGIGPLGWFLLIADIALAANDIHDMYKEMKNTLSEQLKQEPTFRAGFRDEATNTYEIIIDEVIKTLNHELSAEKEDVTFIIDGILGCENILIELEKFNAN
jgi:GTPase SAR1 family protein